ncbi:MAG: hypothetical protein QOG64_2845 [Acidimicrobiaceae bacterium]|nr:hypothetical protein [Acidimicrobiaceae bacterium]
MAAALAASVTTIGAFTGLAASAAAEGGAATSIPVLQGAVAGPAAAGPAETATTAALGSDDSRRWGPGYWMAARDGGVFAFGHAGYFGSMGSAHLNAPIVSMAATPEGAGYWLVSSDGGVFAFGDAGYFGSVGGRHLNAPVVAVAPTPDGGGYWLLSSDGGVFAFGDAGYFGSMGGSHLNGRAVSLARTASGAGYWIATSDGGVFAFGDATYLGSMGGSKINSPVVEVTRAVQGVGYRLVAADGGAFAFGDAGYYGSTGNRRLNAAVSASVEALVPARPAATAAISNQSGYDISWPQCGLNYPAPPYGVAIVGVTGGRPFTTNPCLASQWHWAGAYGSGAAVYMNVSGGPAAGGLAYAWGRASALDALGRARAAGVSAPMWWLDVEFGNTWSNDRTANAQTVQGAIDAVRSAGLAVGVYSTALQWSSIVGGYAPGLPVWVAGAPAASAPKWCDGSHGFGGGATWIVQALPATYDADWVCPAALVQGSQSFALPPVLPAPVVTARPPTAA